MAQARARIQHAVFYASARIKHIAFYPIKGAAGIEIPSATLTEAGLVVGSYADHQFMIVRSQPDERGIHHFITQRDRRDERDRPQGLASMALLKPELIRDRLILTWNHTNAIDLPSDYHNRLVLKVKVWDHESYAIDQGADIAAWLSDHLKLPVSLVRTGESFRRTASQNYMTNDNPLRFQDAYPIHWFPLESLEELSGIAGEDIPWKTFRPQIIVEDLPAQYEHKIYGGTIAGIPFIDPKPCDRCTVTLVDQETGELRKKQPLAALDTYKRWRNREGKGKVIFGENMLPLGHGKISIDDTLVVTSHRDPPLIYGRHL